ncbi:uncharacterized protein LOC108028968 [Drosophila biarmipes]|uniref:uncharacterized protein LOC108028968 n=1 Tax=Drosophila biarmipes TaxID=125945 RepID=UPI0021CC9BCE|nr:uncharacterized protein LOC108028968 [Drosophila biarmipes]
MPLIANQSLKKGEKVKGHKLQQPPSCKVKHGLHRKTSLITIGQKMKKDRKHRAHEENKTTWLNTNGQTIAVEIKHIKNLGMDMNNFFKTKAWEVDQYPGNSSSSETKASVMVNVSQVQTEDKPLRKKIGEFEMLLNPQLVNPIGKRVLEMARKSPRQHREHCKGRVEKHNFGKRSTKSFLKTNKKTHAKKSATNREYDDKTLYESEVLTPWNDFSSDTENDEMHRSEDELSIENESPDFFLEGRVEKHNFGKKSTKSFLKTNKKMYSKKSATNREYDDKTLYESEVLTPWNDFSSDTENDEMHRSEDELSIENESPDFFLEGRVEKHNFGKKSTKSFLKTNKKMYSKKSATNREYDDTTLYESEVLTPWNDFSSDTENDEMHRSEDEFSIENESPDFLLEESYFTENEKITLDEFIIDNNYNFDLNLGNGETSPSEETIPPEEETKPKDFHLRKEEAEIHEKSNCSPFGSELEKPNEIPVEEHSEAPASIKVNKKTKPKDFHLKKEEAGIHEKSNCTPSGSELEKPNEIPVEEHSEPPASFKVNSDRKPLGRPELPIRGNSKPPDNIKLETKVNTDRKPFGYPGNVAVVNPTSGKRNPLKKRPEKRFARPVTNDNGGDDIYPSPPYLRRPKMGSKMSQPINTHKKRKNRFCRQRILERLQVPTERRGDLLFLASNQFYIYLAIILTALSIFIYYKTYIGRPIPRTLWQNFLLTFRITK